MNLRFFIFTLFSILFAASCSSGYNSTITEHTSIDSIQEIEVIRCEQELDSFVSLYHFDTINLNTYPHVELPYYEQGFQSSYYTLLRYLTNNRYIDYNICIPAYYESGKISGFELTIGHVTKSGNTADTIGLFNISPIALFLRLQCPKNKEQRLIESDYSNFWGSKAYKILFGYSVYRYMVEVTKHEYRTKHFEDIDVFLRVSTSNDLKYSLDCWVHIISTNKSVYLKLTNAALKPIIEDENPEIVVNLFEKNLWSEYLDGE